MNFSAEGILPGKARSARRRSRIANAVRQVSGMQTSSFLHGLTRPIFLDSREPNGEPTAADTEPLRATCGRINAGQRLIRPPQATPGDLRIVTGGQGVAGSNPAVPTGRRLAGPSRKAQGSQTRSHTSDDAAKAGATRRSGRNEDSIYFNASKSRRVGATSLGFTPDGDAAFRKSAAGPKPRSGTNSRHCTASARPRCASSRHTRLRPASGTGSTTA